MSKSLNDKCHSHLTLFYRNHLQVISMMLMVHECGLKGQENMPDFAVGEFKARWYYYATAPVPLDLNIVGLIFTIQGRGFGT